MMGEVWVFTFDFRCECGSQTGPKDQGQMTEMTAWHLFISNSPQISAMCASGGALVLWPLKYWCIFMQLDTVYP